MRLAAALLLLAGPAFAATPKAPAEDEPDFRSAAVSGVFRALPPGSSGFPADILMEMRIKLGGEPAPAPRPQAAPESPEPESNGH
ncbi:hypothetical protein GCM10011415_13270 [Salipiger pallidus]|uniref:Uncharacterized protein n=1 Tax=Salipiger pallidus TaxID=1775170 RepID=A0A8J2ZI70_9RHOB|nr:hypothetical protein [Salipiger pallidus]GGG67567.1 hypothetical protein GCM10011415_13270 [Salipiger pallidus]